VDNGQHILLGAYHETLGLLRQIGVKPRVLEHRRLALVYPGVCSLRAAPLPAPLHLALGLLGAKGLGWRDKKAMLGLMQTLKRTGYQRPASETVAELLATTRQTEALTRLIWDPLCVAALNTPIQRASSRVFAAVLRDSLGGAAADSELLIPRVDLSELLPVPATRWLAMRGHGVRTSEPIRGLRRDADTQEWILDGDDGGTRYAHVVVATAPYHAGKLLQPFPSLAPLIGQLDALRYEPITTLWLGFEGALHFPEPMIGLTGGYGQWAFDRSSAEPGLVSVVISASGAHQDLNHDALTVAVLAELSRALGPQPTLGWSRVITEKRATFACTPGIQRPDVLTPEPGLWLAGDYTASDYPATLESAVRSGIRAAQGVMDACGLRVAKVWE
jgi:squalene-associated FAD-dependent desaturase